MKYRCCICVEVFPSEDRIDAYNQGHHVGFLCSLCGANIQDAKLAAYSQAHTKIDKGRLIYLVSVTALAVCIRSFELTIPIGSYQIDWQWFLIATMVLFIVNLGIRWPEQLFNSVADTVPVEKSSKERHKQPWDT